MAYCNYIRTVEYSSAEEMQSESPGVGQYEEIRYLPGLGTYWDLPLLCARYCDRSSANFF